MWFEYSFVILSMKPLSSILLCFLWSSPLPCPSPTISDPSSLRLIYTWFAPLSSRPFSSNLFSILLFFCSSNQDFTPTVEHLIPEMCNTLCFDSIFSFFPRSHLSLCLNLSRHLSNHLLPVLPWFSFLPHVLHAELRNPKKDLNKDSTCYYSLVPSEKAYFSPTISEYRTGSSWKITFDYNILFNGELISVLKTYQVGKCWWSCFSSFKCKKL